MQFIIVHLHPVGSKFNYYNKYYCEYINYKTISANTKTVNKQWIVLDVKNPLGRAATVIANFLRGKYKTNYTPHVDCGDNVVVINSAFNLKWKQMDQKEYVRHTGYPGGKEF